MLDIYLDLESRSSDPNPHDGRHARLGMLTLALPAP
jgi:hypothetical protein